MYDTGRYERRIPGLHFVFFGPHHQGDLTFEIILDVLGVRVTVGGHISSGQKGEFSHLYPIRAILGRYDPSDTDLVRIGYGFYLYFIAVPYHTFTVVFHDYTDTWDIFKSADGDNRGNKYFYTYPVHVPMKAYHEMISISSELRDLEKSLSLLAWDERTYMPRGSVTGRSGMKAVLYKYHHSLITSARLKSCIDELNDPRVLEDMNPIQRASVREMTRAFERRHKIPNELIQKIARASTEGQSAWEKARERSDFKMFLPYLQKNVELKKEFASYMEYENEPYDALLEEFDPGSTAKWIEQVFDPMKKKLSKIVDKISSTGKDPGTYVFQGKDFPVTSQIELCQRLARDVGFDFERGRLDSTVHPFTIGMDHDVRITNRYSPENISSVYSLLHEAGHGMYEQNIDSELFGTPVGKYISMGFHESQSRTWENFVGRSRPFMDHLAPILKEYFPSLGDTPVEDIYGAVNRVYPSLIRVEADEVTYNLHIALRYDIELGLFRDEITPDETEVVWQNKMDEYLGIEPATATEGVLQDVHWSYGQFGYFPSYALGNLYGAQIFKTMEDQIPDIHEKISRGDFGPILGWLKENIYVHGRIHEGPEMLRMLTGEDLNEEHLINYIKDKYSGIYGVSL